MKNILLKCLLLFALTTCNKGMAQTSNFNFGGGPIVGDREQEYNMSFYFDAQFNVISEALGSQGFTTSNIAGFLVVGIRYFNLTNQGVLDGDEIALSWYLPAGIALNFNYKKVFAGFQITYAFDMNKGSLQTDNIDRPDYNGWMMSPRIGVKLSRSLRLMLSYESLDVNDKPFESYYAGLMIEL